MKNVNKKLNERKSYEKYFKHSVFSMEEVFKRIIFFLLHDTKYYRKSDLKIIH